MTSKSFQAQLDDPSTPHNETMKIYTISTNTLCQRKAALSCRVRSFSLALKFLQAVQKWLQVPNGMRWTACLLLSTGPWPQSHVDRFTEFSVDSSKDRLQHILKLAKDKRRDWGGKTEEIQSVVCFMSWQTNTHLTGRAAGSLGSNLLEALNCLFLRSFQKHPKCSCYFFVWLSQSIYCLFHRLLVLQGCWRLVLCRGTVVPSDFPVTWNSFTSSPSATTTVGLLYNPCAGQDYPWGLQPILYTHNSLTNS